MFKSTTISYSRIGRGINAATRARLDEHRRFNAEWYDAQHKKMLDASAASRAREAEARRQRADEADANADAVCSRVREQLAQAMGLSK